MLPHILSHLIIYSLNTYLSSTFCSKQEEYESEQTSMFTFFVGLSVWWGKRIGDNPISHQLLQNKLLMFCGMQQKKLIAHSLFMSAGVAQLHTSLILPGPANNQAQILLKEMAEIQENKSHHTNVLQTFTHIISTNILLAKLSYMANPKIKRVGSIPFLQWIGKGKEHLLNNNPNYHKN